MVDIAVAILFPNLRGPDQMLISATTVGYCTSEGFLCAIKSVGALVRCLAPVNCTSNHFSVNKSICDFFYKESLIKSFLAATIVFNSSFRKLQLFILGIVDRTQFSEKKIRSQTSIAAVQRLAAEFLELNWQNLAYSTNFCSVVV